MKGNKKPLQSTEQLENVLVGIKTATFDPFKEVFLALRANALPYAFLLLSGVFLSLLLIFHADSILLSQKEHLWFAKASKLRAVVGLAFLFFPTWIWGIYRVIQRKRLNQILEVNLTNAGLMTKIGDLPKFIFDHPLDEWTRKLRLRSVGHPLTKFLSVKDILEAGLNVTIAKMVNPSGNKEFVDVVYTLEKMPEIWRLDSLMDYQKFSFPIGKTYSGEIKSSLKSVPHFLIAGETGGGKSTFIRMMTTVLLTNNSDLRVIFIDLKGGMENQVFDGLNHVELVSEIPEVADRLSKVDSMLTRRMETFAKAKAKDIDAFNKLPRSKSNCVSRTLIVVDEFSELVPTIGSPNKAHLANINKVLNRISRLGRAVGIHLAIGIQKPDAKNLDPTIKANLPGIICFAVSHFSQSTIILGNGRASDLSADIKGRAIWKYGLEQVEVQTPLLSEEEVSEAKQRMRKSWEVKDIEVKDNDEKIKEEIKRAKETHGPSS